MLEEYKFNENQLELVALRWLEEVGYTSVSAKELENSGMSKRKDYKDVVLEDRLKEALVKINPDYSLSVIEDAIKKITIPEHPNVAVNNQRFHKFVTDGVEIPTREENRNVTKRVQLFDYENPLNNDFLAVNQFVIEEGQQKKRTDILLFINGLPLVLFELKNATEESVGIIDAYNQLQTYKQEIPSLFTFNEFMVASDGIKAKVGTISSNEERFMVWRTIDGQIEHDSTKSQLEVLIKGMCTPDVLLDLIHHFILFKNDADKVIKILAGYHQYHAVNLAVKQAKRAVSTEGDKKIGVIWHTQGSGKSLSMVFYTGKLVQELDNPTIVVLTDRNDLDDQLFLTFSQSSDLLRQTPKQANNGDELKELLSVNAGGIIFSTMQKFSPSEGKTKMDILTDRRNVIVMADEAHRSQYGFSADVSKTDGKMTYGYAKYLRDALPNASYIGFTGTPISSADKSTRAVFGDYIDTYDMTQAVEDGATVKIFYESRIIPVSLPEGIEIDDVVEDIVEGQDETIANRSKAKWSRVEAITGAKPRLEKLAQDFVTHFETRQEASFGKSMIVTMSRRIAIELYQEIIKLRPEWHSDDDDKGKIKIVMTGSSSDPDYWQPFIGNKARRDKLAKRMKDDSDELQIVIVRDMWLTGFDVPSMNTMYIDKPMQGHNLMQAIARVNRVFKDKTGGLIVDYIGIAPNLKNALQEYTPNDQKQAGIDTKLAVNLVKEKYDLITRTILDKCDYSEFNSSDYVTKLAIITNTANFILGLGEEEVKRFKDLVTEITRAYALCVTEDEVQSYNAEIAFFKAVKVYLIKLNFVDGIKSPQQIDEELKQLISKSVVTEDIVDIYDSLGLEKAELSILSDSFLEEIKTMPQKKYCLTIIRKSIGR